MTFCVKLLWLSLNEMACLEERIGFQLTFLNLVHLSSCIPILTVNILFIYANLTLGIPYVFLTILATYEESLVMKLTMFNFSF